MTKPAPAVRSGRQQEEQRVLQHTSNYYNLAFARSVPNITETPVKRSAKRSEKQ